MRTSRCLALLALLWPTAAFASGSLTISLQDDHSRAIEGTATARPVGGGTAKSCSTRGGRCSIPGLAAGRYQVSATLIRGGLVPAANVAVVEGRAASVRLTALPPPTTGTSQQTVGAAGPPQVPNAGPGGGTHPGAAPGPGVVNVRPGATATAQMAQAPVVRPGLPGQGPRPIVTQGPSVQTAQAGTVVSGMAPAGNATPPRNLGTGQHATILGRTQDQRGRVVEGSVSVQQANHTVGTVSTTGGAFTAFDLAPGQYVVSFTALTGQRATANVTVTAGPAASVRLTINR